MQSQKHDNELRIRKRDQKSEHKKKSKKKSRDQKSSTIITSAEPNKHQKTPSQNQGGNSKKSKTNKKLYVEHESSQSSAELPSSREQGEIRSGSGSSSEESLQYANKGSKSKQERLFVKNTAKQDEGSAIVGVKRDLRTSLNNIIEQDNDSQDAVNPQTEKLNRKMQKIREEAAVTSPQEKSDSGRADLGSRLGNMYGAARELQRSGMLENDSKGIKIDTETTQQWQQSILLPKGSFLFSENTKKCGDAKKTKDLTKKEKKSSSDEDKDEDEKFEKIRADKEHKRNYLSTISTKFNPDVLVGGAQKFIRGNEYFSGGAKKSKSKKPEEAKERGLLTSGAEDNDSVDEDGDEDLLAAMKKMGCGRYWTEENIALKCHNCRQFGHLAKDCPNETKKPTCILCGKDTHDSFECTEKLCFKCNEVGHTARDCTAKNIINCKKCGAVGHRENRCLKIWMEPTKGQLKHIRCIECGQRGHIKCTTESQSMKIKISARVLENLNEFVQQKFEEAELSESEDQQKALPAQEGTEVDAFDYVKRNKRHKKNTKKLTKKQRRVRDEFLRDSNVKLQESSDSYDSEEANSESSYDSEEAESPDSYSEKSSNSDADPCLTKKRRYKKFKSKQSQQGRKYQVYCCYCAGRHAEDDCHNKHFIRQNRMMQMREQFEKATSFKVVGQPYNFRKEEPRRYYDREHRDYDRSKSRDRDYRTDRRDDRRDSSRQKPQDRRKYGSSHKSSNSGHEQRDYGTRSRDRDNKYSKSHQSNRNDRNDRRDKKDKRSGGNNTPSYSNWQASGQQFQKHSTIQPDVNKQQRYQQNQAPHHGIALGQIQTINSQDSSNQFNYQRQFASETMNRLAAQQNNSYNVRNDLNMNNNAANFMVSPQQSHQPERQYGTWIDQSPQQRQYSNTNQQQQILTPQQQRQLQEQIQQQQQANQVINIIHQTFINNNGSAKQI